jgi:uncharacterized protein
MTRTPLALIALALAAPAIAQYGSPQYQFLQAVKDGKAEDVQSAVEKPGSRMVDTRDLDSGEGALHIVVRRGDLTYLRYFLQHGADPNLRDNKGTTPLLLAVTLGQTDAIPLLLTAHANVNLANDSGETPLIRAVERRDLATVRDLLAAGANPDLRDHLAGLSAREYAARDTRAPGLIKVINEKPEKPINVDIAGPKL